MKKKYRSRARMHSRKYQKSLRRCILIPSRDEPEPALLEAEAEAEAEVDTSGDALNEPVGDEDVMGDNPVTSIAVVEVSSVLLKVTTLVE
jgi:hypothetical protein